MGSVQVHHPFKVEITNEFHIVGLGMTAGASMTAASVISVQAAGFLTGTASHAVRIDGITSRIAANDYMA